MYTSMATRAVSGLLALALSVTMCPAAGLAYAAEGEGQRSASSESSGAASSGSAGADRVNQDVALGSSAGDAAGGEGPSSGFSSDAGSPDAEEGPSAEDGAASSDASSRYTGSSSGHTSADVPLGAEATVGTIEHAGLAYTINEDDGSTVSVTGLASTKPAGDVQIPAQIASGDKLYAVTAIKMPGLAEDANPYAEELFDDSAKALAVKSVSIPQSVASIDPAFFQLIPNAVDINVSTDNSVYTSYDGALYSADLTQLILVPQGRGSLVLPQSLAAVPAYVLSRCDKLSAISFPGGTGNDFLAVRNNVLYTNDLSTLLAAPAGLGASASIASECTTIAEGAFFGNATLDTIVVNGVVEGIASAGDSATGADGQPLMGGSAVDGSTLPAFDGATVANATVVINVSAEADGDEASAMIERAKAAWVAYGFTNFKEPAAPGTEITPEEGSGFAFALLPDYTLSVRWAGSTEPPAAIDIPDYGIIDGVQYTVSTIAGNAFSNYTSLITVDIPQTVTSIGNSAFELCTSLQTVHFDSVVSIGSKAFANTALLSLVLPTTVQSIGDNAFSNMKETTIVALGSIADNSPIALGAAAGLNVYVPYGTEDAWDAGIPTLGNHIYPYGVKLSDEPLELEVGQTANINDNGYIEAPGVIEATYAYKANPVSISTDDGTIEAKAAGSSNLEISLTIEVPEVVVNRSISRDQRLERASFVSRAFGIDDAYAEEPSGVQTVSTTRTLALGTAASTFNVAAVADVPVALAAYTSNITGRVRYTFAAQTDWSVQRESDNVVTDSGSVTRAVGDIVPKPGLNYVWAYTQNFIVFGYRDAEPYQKLNIYNVRSREVGKYHNQKFYTDANQTSEIAKDQSWWSGDTAQTIDVYPGWAYTSYTINYGLDGGTGMSTPSSVSGKKMTDTITLPSFSSSFTKDGYICTGWKVGSTVHGSGATVNVGTLATQAGRSANQTTDTITITPAWAARNNNITLNLYAGPNINVNWYYDHYTIDTVHVNIPGTSSPYKTVSVNAGGSAQLTGAWSVWHYPGNGIGSGNCLVHTYSSGGASNNYKYNISPASRDIGKYVTNRYYTNSALTSEFASGSSYWSTNTSAAQTVNVYPGWAYTSYTVAYAANGGTGSQASVTGRNITHSITLPTAANSGITRAGYTLSGWTIGSSTYNPGASVSVGTMATAGSMPANATTGTITLNAQWTANTYSVKYNSNGATSGSMSNSSHTYGTAKALSANAYQKTYYTFKGWATSQANANAGTVAYTDKQSVTNLTSTNGATVELFAVWQPRGDIAYSVRHWQQNLDGAVGTHDSSNYTLKDTENFTNGTADGTVSPAVKTYTGFTAPSVTQASIKNDGSLVVDYYYTRNSYSVTLADVTGIQSKSISVDPVSALSGSKVLFGASVTATAVAATGYTIGNWTTTDLTSAADSWTTPSAGRATFIMPAKNVVLTPGIVLDTYTVTINTDGAAVSGWTTVTDKSTYTKNYNAEGSDVVLPVLSKLGYTFSGWVETGSVGAVPEKNVTVPKNAAQNKSYDAVFAIIEYSIALDGAGKATPSQPADKFTVDASSGASTSFTLPSIASDFYDLAGWAIGGSVYSAGDSADISDVAAQAGSNNVITFTAQWTPKVFTVEFEEGDVTIGANADWMPQLMNLPYDASASGTGLALPVHDAADGWKVAGKTFKGWGTAKNASASLAVDGSTAYFAKDLISDDRSNVDIASQTITLYALWSDSAYTISYQDNDPAHLMVADGVKEAIALPAGVAGAVYDDLSGIDAGSLDALIGYTFSGWKHAGASISANASAADAFEAVYGDEWMYEGSKELTLAPQWSSRTFTIDYDKNGGSAGSGGDYSVGLLDFDGQTDLPTQEVTGYSYPTKNLVNWLPAQGGSAVGAAGAANVSISSIVQAAINVGSDVAPGTTKVTLYADWQTKDGVAYTIVRMYEVPGEASNGRTFKAASTSAGDYVVPSAGSEPIDTVIAPELDAETSYMGHRYKLVDNEYTPRGLGADAKVKTMKSITLQQNASENVMYVYYQLQLQATFSGSSKGSIGTENKASIVMPSEDSYYAWGEEVDVPKSSAADGIHSNDVRDYVFAGWSVSADGSDPASLDGCKIEDDITYHAAWTPVVYTINYVAYDNDVSRDGVILPAVDKVQYTTRSVAPAGVMVTGNSLADAAANVGYTIESLGDGRTSWYKGNASLGGADLSDGDLGLFAKLFPDAQSAGVSSTVSEYSADIAAKAVPNEYTIRLFKDSGTNMQYEVSGTNEHKLVFGAYDANGNAAGEADTMTMPSINDLTVSGSSDDAKYPGYSLSGWNVKGASEGATAGAHGTPATCDIAIGSDKSASELIGLLGGVEIPLSTIQGTAARYIDVHAVWNVAYSLDVPDNSKIASLSIDASTKEVGPEAPISVVSRSAGSMDIGVRSVAGINASALFKGADEATLQRIMFTLDDASFPLSGTSDTSLGSLGALDTFVSSLGMKIPNDVSISTSGTYSLEDSDGNVSDTDVRYEAGEGGQYKFDWGKIAQLIWVFDASGSAPDTNHYLKN